MTMNAFHMLQGQTIGLKALNTGDAEAIHHFASDEEVSRFIGWKLMKTLNETREFIELMLKRESEGTHYYASIVLKSTQEVIGTAMIFNLDQVANKAEIGYVLDKGYWGNGYGSECVALMNQFGFESLNLHKLYASVVDANRSSARILEKNGYELEGRLKDHYFIENTYYDALLYGKIQAKK